jgi:hypothetical protein
MQPTREVLQPQIGGLADCFNDELKPTQHTVGVHSPSIVNEPIFNPSIFNPSIFNPSIFNPSIRTQIGGLADCFSNELKPRSAQLVLQSSMSQSSIRQSSIRQSEPKLRAPAA